MAFEVRGKRVNVVGAARNSWLIRDNIEVKSQRSLPVDSFESTSAGAKR